MSRNVRKRGSLSNTRSGQANVSRYVRKRGSLSHMRSGKANVSRNVRKPGVLSHTISGKANKSRNVRKRIFGHQIGSTNAFVQSVQYLNRAHFQIVKDAKLLHEDNEDSDQTAQIRRLICFFVRRIPCQKVFPS